MISTLITQLSLDYCCLPEQVTDSRNHFTVYSRQEGRRKFQEGNDCFLKIAALNGKLLFTGREDIIEACRSRYQDADGAWFMDVKNLAELEKLLSSYGYRIEQAHPFFIAADPSPVDTDGFEIRRYEGKEIEQFRGDERFDEAFAFCEDAPDVLGIAALQDGKILGMAGASADSPYLWQIGINVQPEARRKNIAAMLVALLKNDILEKGRLPYYGTSMSHIASQRVALRAGFLPAWSELVTSPLPDRATEDLLIRETDSGDLPNLLSLWNNGNVMQFVGFPDGLGETMEGLERWLVWIRENRPKTNHYSIYLPDGTYCGESFYQIDPEQNNTASLDIKLLPAARGRGIATKALSYAVRGAFDQGASLVWVDPNPANEKALALYDRLGFHRKPLPDHLRAEAEGADFIPVYMEITRKEYESRKGLY